MFFIVIMNYEILKIVSLWIYVLGVDDIFCNNMNNRVINWVSLLGDFLLYIEGWFSIGLFF